MQLYALMPSASAQPVPKPSRSSSAGFFHSTTFGNKEYLVDDDRNFLFLIRGVVFCSKRILSKAPSGDEELLKRDTLAEFPMPPLHKALRLASASLCSSPSVAFCGRHSAFCDDTMELPLSSTVGSCVRPKVPLPCAT